MKQEGKGVLLVTGASRGIGAATALLAGARGYAVGVNYRQDARAAEGVVRQIEQGGGRAMALQADVSREQEVLDMFEACTHRLGAISGLVNNAGILEEGKMSKLNRMFDTHPPLEERIAALQEL